MKRLSLKVIIPQIILAAVCIASAVWGIMSMDDLKKASIEQTQNNIEAVQSLDKLSADFQEMQKLLLTHFVAASDEVDNVRKKIDVTIADVEKEKATYQKWMVGKKEKEMYSQFSENYKKFYSLYMESLTWSEKEDKGKAIEIANYDLTEIETQMEEDVDNLIELRQKSSDASVKEQEVAFDQSIAMNFSLIILSVIISMLAICSCYMTIVSPVKKSTRSLRAIIKKVENNECDLSERVPVKTKDEIGQLVKGINAFLDTLQNVIGDMSRGSNNLESAIAGVTESVTSVNSASGGVSEVMEQLAASMEEVSATIITVDQSVSEVEKTVSNFAENSDSILNYSQEMQERAEGLEKNAVESQKITSDMVGEIIEQLKEAIEHSKSVEQIESLTNEILSISSQTNLLALNASIEAARAGEAGKGFAVVADEICQLADSSRETANNIQKINETVIAAVNELSESSNSMVDYIDQKILPDYKGFVESGKKYNQDSMYINQRMNEFSEKADSISAVTQELYKSIEEITKVIESSAMSVEDAAKETVALTAEIQKIQKDMDISEEVALQMKDQCERFENA
ncbi:MAG: methyl-accepting chemotaxis protein [Butyribacter sp.]|nr:methyl-accepting chemotaxis protein [bacterium]MDY3855119.1 methyl-accepting chemotaxis protein [Butyribacter sp.]